MVTKNAVEWSKDWVLWSKAFFYEKVKNKLFKYVSGLQGLFWFEPEPYSVTPRQTSQKLNPDFKHFFFHTLRRIQNRVEKGTCGYFKSLSVGINI